MLKAGKKPQQEETDEETPTPQEPFREYNTSNGYAQAPATAIAAPPSQPSVPRAKQKPARRTSSLTLYDKIMNKIGLSLGVLLCIILWGTGGYFTLVWLRSLGLPVQVFGSPVILTIWWLIPLGITILEVGLDPERSPYENRHSFWAWIVILGFDTLATAAGIVSMIQGKNIASQTIEWYTAWLIGIFVGLVLARYPEKFGRGLWRDLFR
jgi:magnesium-transporting ATPase (P-type)